jgi:hypothetical protein
MEGCPGRHEDVLPELSDNEHTALKKSAQILKEAASELGF